MLSDTSVLRTGDLYAWMLLGTPFASTVSDGSRLGQTRITTAAVVGKSLVVPLALVLLFFCSSSSSLPCACRLAIRAGHVLFCTG